MSPFTAGEVEALLDKLLWMARLREAVSPGQPEPLVTAVAKLEDERKGALKQLGWNIDLDLMWRHPDHGPPGTQHTLSEAAELAGLSPSGEHEGMSLEDLLSIFMTGLQAQVERTGRIDEEDAAAKLAELIRQHFPGAPRSAE